MRSASARTSLDVVAADLRTLRIRDAHLYSNPTAEEEEPAPLVPRFTKVHSLRITFPINARAIDARFFRVLLRAVTPSLKLLSMEGGNNDLYLDAAPELEDLLPRIPHLVISSVLDSHAAYLSLLTFATTVTRLTLILTTDELCHERFAASFRSVLDSLPAKNQIETVAIECNLAQNCASTANVLVSHPRLRKLRRLELPVHTRQNFRDCLYREYTRLPEKSLAKGVTFVWKEDLSGELRLSLGLGGRIGMY